MIGHQDIAVQLNAKTLNTFRNDFQELLSVLVVGKDPPSLVAAAGHVVPGARILDAQGTGHESMLLWSRRGCLIKNKALILFTNLLFIFTIYLMPIYFTPKFKLEYNFLGGRPCPGIIRNLV